MSRIFTYRGDENIVVKKPTTDSVICISDVPPLPSNREIKPLIVGRWTEDDGRAYRLGQLILNTLRGEPL
jgi:hypothetical protein